MFLLSSLLVVAVHAVVSSYTTTRISPHTCMHVYSLDMIMTGLSMTLLPLLPLLLLLLLLSPGRPPRHPSPPCIRVTMPATSTTSWTSGG